MCVCVCVCVCVCARARANGNPCIFDLPFVARQYEYVGADLNVIMHLLAGFSGDFGVFFGRLC